MKPPTEQIGIHRMKLFIEEFAGKHDVNIPFVYKGNLDMISPIQWKIIGENVMEALTNAMKYADATVISIDIHVLNKMVKVQVKDNGKGAVLVKERSRDYGDGGANSVSKRKNYCRWNKWFFSNNVAADMRMNHLI